MSEENESKSLAGNTVQVPGWYMGVSGIALVWNIMGLMAFFMHLAITPEILAQMPQTERALYENAPGWMTIVFALAVFAGTFGCVGLLMKKSWAFLLFVISLVSVLIQNGYSFFMTHAIEVMGSQAVIMPSIVIVIAIALVWFSYAMKSRNMLS